MSDLQRLMDEITRRYRFDGQSYPDLMGANESACTDFAIRHMLLHMNKACGKIATYAEVRDHGGDAGKDELKEAAMKIVMNGLRMAELLGMTAEDVASEIPKYMK